MTSIEFIGTIIGTLGFIAIIIMFYFGIKSGLNPAKEEK